MIRHMQKGIFASLFIAMLVLAAFSLVLTDWTGTFRAGQGGGDIARMRGDKITVPEFTTLVSRVARSENMSPADAYERGLVNQILTSEIWQRLLALNVGELGVRIDDATLLLRLKEMAAPIAAQEKTDVAQVLKRYISNQGLSEAEFLDMMRRDLGNGLIRRIVASGASPSVFIMQDILAHTGQTRDIQYMVLKDGAVDVPTPTDEQIKEYYAMRQNDFMIPEHRDIMIGFLSHETILGQIKINDQDIKSYAEAHSDLLQKAEKRTIDFIVFKNESDAKEAFAAVKGQNDFKQIMAKKFPSAKIDQGTFEKTDSLPDYLKPVFSAQNGDVMGPVQTPLGFYVMHVTSITPAGIQSFDDARGDIEKILKEERLSDRMDKMLDDLNTASDRGDSFDTVVKVASLTPVAIGMIGRDGKTVNGTDALQNYATVKTPILTSAFSDGEPGRVLPPLELSNGDIAVVHVKSITPAHPQDLADIKGKLILDYMAMKRREKNIVQAQSMLSDWIAEKTDLNKMATAHGVVLQTVPRAARTQKDIPAPLDRAAWGRLFAATPGVPVFEPIPGGVMMAVVQSVSLADPQKVSDIERAEVMNVQMRAQSEEQIAGYMGTLSDRHAPRVNDRLVKKIFDRSGAEQQ